MRNSLPAQRGVACAVLACVIGSLFTTFAQSQRPADQNQDRIVISKDEVLFDVVVRDKKGKLIKDLTLADFEVYEDGVKQNVDSFRFVSSTVAETAAAPAPSTNTNAPATTTESKETKTPPRTVPEEVAGVSAVALVFDRLSPESRLRARNAALSYLGESVKKTELVGVFLNDLKVIVVQPFTYDTQQIKAGIEKVGISAPSLYTSNNEQARAARTDVTIGLLRQSQNPGPPAAGTEFIIRVDQAKKVYDTDFSVVVVFKDQTGRTLGKLSSQYKLNGPIDKVEEAKKQRILFYREANLPPGRYDVETIAYDTPSGRASVRAGVVEVPASEDGKLRLSDVMLLKRAEPVAPADNNTSNPFRVGNLIVHPNLGEPIPRSLKQVPFFFTVYVPAGAASKPKLTIELVAQGTTLSKMPGELAEIDAMGRSQFVAGLPVEQIPAGNYELKITVSADGTSVSRSRSFTLVD